MQKKLGTFYNYMVFVKDNTEENSRIIIPPQEEPWLSVGNRFLVRYFLHPRIIIQGQYENNPSVKADYILISEGGWTASDPVRYGWPKVFVAAEKIVYFDIEEKSVSTQIKDYDPDELQNKTAWGIIKLNSNN